MIPAGGTYTTTAKEAAELVNAIKQYSSPVVMVNRYLRSMDLSSVCIDNQLGGYRATEYLIKNFCYSFFVFVDLALQTLFLLMQKSVFLFIFQCCPINT